MCTVNHPGIRDQSRFMYPLQYAGDIDDFKSRFEYTSQSWSIALGDTSLDIELHLKKARPKVLVVFLGGAKIEQDWGKPGPFFLGRNFSKSIEANMLFISDPTFAFDQDIRLGWYLGTKQTPAQPLITKLIDTVVNLLGAEFVVFFGGSGGGFASMYHSALFPGSLALIWNPQLNIQQYHVQAVVEETSRIAFGCDKNILSNYAVTDVAPLYRNGASNKVLFWQNITDHHVEEQLDPFLHSLGLSLEKKIYSDWVNENIFLFLNDKAIRHEAPPKHMLLKLLYTVTLKPGYLTDGDYRSIFRDLV